jgi:cytoskeletal protein RodZ
VKITGTSEPGSKVYINDALVSDADGSFNYEWPLKVGENKITVKTVDPSGNEMSETYTITKEKEEVSPTESIKGSNNLILAIILLIVGIAVGAIVGYVAGKPKKQAPPEEQAPSRPSKPAREEQPPRREAPRAAPAPAPAKAEVKAAPKKEAPAPKPEPKSEPKPEPKSEPKKDAPKKEASKNKTDADLDEILKGLK